jgi:hypothetical protein
MLGAIGGLVVCVLNDGSPGAGPRMNGFPLGIRLPLPPLDLPFCLPLPLPLGTNKGLPLPISTNDLPNKLLTINVRYIT